MFRSKVDLMKLTSLRKPSALLLQEQLAGLGASKPQPRIALLASSALVLASLSAGASLFVPRAASAANECSSVGVDPGNNADAPDSFTCDQQTEYLLTSGSNAGRTEVRGLYANGITYNADGNLSVEMIVEPTAVTDPPQLMGAAQIAGAGIDLRAEGGDSITFDSLSTTLRAGAPNDSLGMTGAVLDVRTEDGLIDISVGSIDADETVSPNATHGVYAQSITGDINILADGGSIATRTSGSVARAAIEAVSDGGDITVHQDFNGNSATATGRLYGIRAVTTGTGNVTITNTPRPGGGGNMASTGSAGVAVIDAGVGTGLLTIDLSGSIANTNATNGIGIRTTSQGGNVVINLGEGASVSAGSNSSTSAVTALEVNMNGGTTTINNSAGRFGENANARRDDRILRAIGDGTIVFDNDTSSYGNFDLGAFGGSFSFTNAAGIGDSPVQAGGWATLGASTFSDGDDTVTNLAGGAFVIGIQGGTGMVLQTSSFAFGDGEDTLANAGTIVVGQNSSNNTSQTVGKTLEITGLETFNNSGLIVMGGYHSDTSRLGEETDGYYDDVMIMRDGHFHGEDGSRIWLDANLNSTGQTSCARNAEDLPQNVALASPADGRLRANDCLDFRGGTASGRTGLIINDVLAGDRGSYNPEGNVVVDMAGGEAASIDPDAFYVAPETPGYVSTSGGFLDKGLFAYTVGYDPQAQAFKIYGVESPSTMQFSLLGQAANDLWRTATAPWLERRVAQRNDEEGGELTPRFWLRGALSSADRTVSDSIAAGAATLDYDTSYTQKDASLAIGMDLIRGAAFGGDLVLGAMAGYAQARMTYDASPNEATFEGGGVGLYSGFTAGPFFNDVVVNATLTNLLIDVPSLNLRPTGTLLESDVHTIGAQMETGLRFAVGPVRLEPLASISWSQASFDSIEVPADDPLRFGGEVDLDDARSTRAGLGLRVGMNDVAPRVFPIDVHLTGRSMQELDGETAVTIVNLGPDANLSRTFDGAYNELNAGVSVGESGDHFGAFLNVGGAWGDDYEARNGSVGLRLRW